MNGRLSKKAFMLYTWGLLDEFLTNHFLKHATATVCEVMSLLDAMVCFGVVGKLS